MEILKKIGEFLSKVLKNILYRLKPRLTFRWIFSFVIWLIIFLYLGFGVYFGLQIYKYKSTSRLAIDSSFVYPFPAAVINGKLILASTYFKEWGYLQTFSSKTKQTFSDPETLNRGIINQLAENQIIEFQALKYNIHVTSKEFNDEYAKIQGSAGGRAEMKKVLHELYGMSEREFKQHVYAQVLKQKMRDQLMVQVKVAHILVKDETRANDLAKQVRAGGNFADLAKQYSEDTSSRDNAGELGWLARGQLQIDNKPLPEFDQAVFAAKIGDIVGPVKTVGGFEIVKIEGFKGIISDNFDSWLANLEKQAHIRLFVK